MKKKLKKNKGIVFWITGLSGSGKTSLAKKIAKKIGKNYGPCIEISGDEIRSIFKMRKYDKLSRLNYASNYSRLCKKIADKNINVIFSTVSLIKDVRTWNKKNIENYLEIYVKADIKKLIKKNSKKFFKNSKEIVGLSQKPEFPTKQDITIFNNLDMPIYKLSDLLIKKINKILPN